MHTLDFPITAVPSPAYVLDERLLKKNMAVFRQVQKETGCKILAAQKGFSMYAEYGLLKESLCGTTASSLHEARLGYEEMGKEVHIFAPAYRDHEFAEIMQYCDHIVFNSIAQWKRFHARTKQTDHPIECGLRVNPGYSEITTEIYNPCAKYSRLGILPEQLEGECLEGICGLHFHTMCEQNSDTLARTLKVVEEKFSRYFDTLKWVNFGGGHHITRDDYDVELLIRTIRDFKARYPLEVYLEPGEAIALNTGYLICTVLDIVENGMAIAILDTSAACHMPDVLEMPYRPHVLGSGMPDEKAYTYRFGGPTCLAGDIIGDYSFDQPLCVGDRLVFCDMAHYTMVKNNTFNGINLPAIARYREGTGIEVLKEFGYEDFKSRL